MPNANEVRSVARLDHQGIVMHYGVSGTRRVAIVWTLCALMGVRPPIFWIDNLQWGYCSFALPWTQLFTK